MADGKELKPKSFRIDDETAQKFKEISSAIGGNQQETLAKLIEAFEFQSGKAILVGKKADIGQFEKYTTAITRMFMSSLEDNQNITETVRTEFDALLVSKDSVIQNLQKKLSEAERIKEESAIKAQSFADENNRLNDVIDSMQKEFDSKMDDMQNMLSDKDSLNRALTDSCNSLKAKAESMEEEARQAAANLEELNRLKKELEASLMKQSELEAQLEHEKNAHEKDVADLRQHEKDALHHQEEQLLLEREKATLEIERKYQEKIQQAAARAQEEADKYRTKYFDLLEQAEKQATEYFDLLEQAKRQATE